MNFLGKRSSGVLMHVSSLPGSGGIGSFGKEAYAFVDSLVKAGQAFWQLLPLGPTGYKDSPYQVFSTFAGNPYFISLELLTEQGFLKDEDWKALSWGENEACVDYGALYVNRKKVYSVLYENFKKDVPVDFKEFCAENDFWLCDYALFMAIKDSLGGSPLSLWDKKIRLREPSVIKELSSSLCQQIELYKMLQYFFYKQWNALKSYANSKGVKIIGDLPIYVSGDSSDVWANPELFELDSEGNPKGVAGCPPDSFSADGQLWGNPVYDWEANRKTSYAWWLKRILFALKLYDVCRFDHFRGFESFYRIPFGETTAKNGAWCKGPGMELFGLVKQNVKKDVFIAEDLGFLTPEVFALLHDTGFPGMKILQFAFDSREENDYMPENYTPNCVVYTGTHDNEPILGWAQTAPECDVQEALKYFAIDDVNLLPQKMMQAALKSKANTCILTAQDLLYLGHSARMNTPGAQENNWTWRATSEQMKNFDWDFLRCNTISCSRV